MFRIKNPILQLALPNIVSNITVPLVGMVDLALMGHLGSEVHLNAIAIGAGIFSFIYLIFNFLRTSTTGFAAQAYGANDPQEQAYWQLGIMGYGGRRSGKCICSGLF